MSNEGEAAGRRVDAYLNTVDRLEPDITMDAAAASIAISLKRIADSLEKLPDRLNDLFLNYLRASRG